MNADQDRRAYIDGLRQLADILEQHPTLSLPYHGARTNLLWVAAWDADHRAVAAEFARAIPGTIAKQPRGDALDVVGQVAGLKVQLIVDRDQVCERVVVGTEQVTIPAQPATEAQPGRVEEREVVRWECRPLLSETVEQVSA